MLQITIKGGEFWNEKTQEFVYAKDQVLQLEHSLVSISKWEMKWEKPFLSDNDKTAEEMLDYIRCMTITQNVDPSIYMALNAEQFNQINEYINAKATATTFSNLDNKPAKKEIITSEVVYYWMIAQNIPMECQKWHLNRLLTLIKVCSIKNTPPKKMSGREIASRNAEINAARRRKLGTKG